MVKKGASRKAKAKASKGQFKEMPNMRSKSSVEAVVFGDLHLSLNAPVARAEKNEDWFTVMKKNFDEVGRIARYNNAKYIISTGDIFHAWNSPVELVNFAIKMFQSLNLRVYSVAGNHDLPNHDHTQIERSAYWTLVEAGAIVNLEPKKPIYRGDMCLHGFPCGFPAEGKIRKSDYNYNVAVIHDYCHKYGHDFPGAPEDKRCQRHRERLKGFDAAFFGDNHKGFLDVNDKLDKYMPILNVGGFVQRNIDEQTYKPMVGLLHTDGQISTVPLNVEAKWELEITEYGKDPEGAMNNADMNAVIDMIQDIKGSTLDYREALEQYLRRKRVTPSIKQILTSLISGKE